MQILAIILYSSTGEIRELQFNLGKVNIVTGESKTGKTAIIDIVDYCLGSDTCSVREGVVRDYVEWYALKLQLPGEQVFIARQNPSKINQVSTNQIYFANADSVDTPPLADIQNNSNIENLKYALEGKLGIGEYTNKPDEKSTRLPLPVTFKHSRIYSFQPQFLIAQPDYLFYNQTEPFVPQTIKDTLPYFLGAVREDTVKIEQSIAQAKRELNRLSKIHQENLRIKNEGSKRLGTLIEEARQVNLLNIQFSANNEKDAIEELKKLLQWTIEDKEYASPLNDNLKTLIEQKNALSRELTGISEDISAAKSFERDAHGYKNEVGQQEVRLQTVQIYKKHAARYDCCPLCDQELKIEIPSITAINTSLEKLRENLQTTKAETPRINTYINGLENRREELIKQIEERSITIKSLYKEIDEAKQHKDLSLRQGKVIGRISLFLESYQETVEDRTLQKRIEEIQKEILSLESLISSEEKTELLEAAMNKVNTQMTKWKDQLDLEYQNAPIRFDLRKLTLFADTDQKPIPLNLMGSGANWVAYHLLIHFALHKLFIQSKRPTPHFLILDQPSQVYFPPEKDLNNTGEISQSSDEFAVFLIFKFMLNVAQELFPEFQVIVTDHANIKTSNFQEAIIEEWRNGTKLVPMSWIPEKENSPVSL